MIIYTVPEVDQNRVKADTHCPYVRAAFIASTYRH